MAAMFLSSSSVLSGDILTKRGGRVRAVVRGAWRCRFGGRLFRWRMAAWSRRLSGSFFLEVTEAGCVGTGDVDFQVVG